MKNNESKSIAENREETARKAFSPSFLYLAALCVAITTILVYLPSLGNDFVLWDDDFIISENPNLRPFDLDFIIWSLTATGITLWYPVTLISFSLDYSLWGLDPWGFHLTNLIFHGLNASLVVFLAFRLIRKGGMDKRSAVIAAAVAALLFALHPMRVESVAWVTERKDVLYAFFSLLSFIVYLSYVKSEGNRRYYLLSLFFFALSLMSKPMAVTLPAVLLIIDYYPLRRFSHERWFEKGRALLIEKLPYFALSLAVVAITLWFGKEFDSLDSLEKAPLADRFFISCYGYGFYLLKMIMPTELAPFYPYPPAIDIFSLPYFGSLLFILLLSCAAFFSTRPYPFLLAIWLYYLVTLLPVIGIVKSGEFAVAVRYSYLPCLGFAIAGGAGIVSLFYKYASAAFRGVVVAGVCFLLGLFVWQTEKNITVWRDSESLWSYEIALFPNHTPLPYNNRGVARFQRGELEDSLKDYDRAIGIAPDYYRAWYNRGKTLAAMGRNDEAIKNYNRAVELNPDYADAYNNRGVAYREKGVPEKALRDYSKAIEINPLYFNAYNNRANILKQLGDYEGAIGDYKKAVKINPRYADAYYNMANLFASLNNHGEAINNFSKSIEHSGGFWQAFFNRGNSCLAVGNLRAAIDDYRAAASLNPRNGAIHYALSLAYSREGEGSNERASLEQAASLGYDKAREKLRDRTVRQVGG